MTINEITEYYSTEEIADIIEKYWIRNENALAIALKIERWQLIKINE